MRRKEVGMHANCPGPDTYRARGSFYERTTKTYPSIAEVSRAVISAMEPMPWMRRSLPCSS